MKTGKKIISATHSYYLPDSLGGARMHAEHMIAKKRLLSEKWDLYVNHEPASCIGSREKFRGDLRKEQKLSLNEVFSKMAAYEQNPPIRSFTTALTKDPLKSVPYTPMRIETDYPFPEEPHWKKIKNDLKL